MLRLQVFGTADRPITLRAFGEGITLLEYALHAAYAAYTRPDGDADRVQWHVVALGVDPVEVNVTPVPPLPETVTTVLGMIDALEGLERGTGVPPWNAEVLERLQTWLGHAAHRSWRWRMAWEDRSTEVSGAAAEFLRTHRPPLAKELLGLTGRLEMVNLHYQWAAALYADGTGQRIPCEFAPDLLPALLQVLGQRVFAEGMAVWVDRRRTTLSRLMLHTIGPFPRESASPNAVADGPQEG